MPRNIYGTAASLKPMVGIVPINQGGTGANNAQAAVVNLGGIHVSELGQPNGPAQAGPAAAIILNELPTPMPIGVTAEGATSLSVNQSAQIHITNYDNAATYSLTAITGTVTRNGDMLTYNAPATPGSGGFIINNKVVSINVVL